MPEENSDGRHAGHDEQQQPEPPCRPAVDGDEAREREARKDCARDDARVQGGAAVDEGGGDGNGQCDRNERRRQHERVEAGGAVARRLRRRLTGGIG
jgi:hypothetical protein